MGRLGLKERRFLAEILLGFILRDYRRVAEVHFEAGYVPSHHSVDDFAQAIRAIGEPIHQRRADEISMAKVLTLLFDVTALFDMSTRTELVMLQKTMVVVEGVARSLDPRLDMWTTAEPVVRAWLGRNLGPIGRADQARRACADARRRGRRRARPRPAGEARAGAPRRGGPARGDPRGAPHPHRDQADGVVDLGLWAIAGSLLAIALR